MSISTDQQLLVEARLSNERRSTGVAYALWFFLGLFSAHRFYLGRPKTAILQIVTILCVVGIIWWIIDAFLIPEMTRQHTAEIRERLLVQFASPSIDGSPN